MLTIASEGEGGQLLLELTKSFTRVNQFIFKQIGQNSCDKAARKLASELVTANWQMSALRWVIQYENTKKNNTIFS